MTVNYLQKELYDLVKKESKIFDFLEQGTLDGIWYWDLENKENEWMSPKFWKTLGYDPNEKKHKTSEWRDIIFEEDLKPTLDNFEKHCQDPSFKYDQIVRYKHKNGSTVWIRCRGLAIRNSMGKPIRMLGAHTDITELKKAEENIKSISDEYEKVFNGTQDAMFLVKIEGYKKFRYIRNNLSHQTKTKISLEVLRNKTPQELLGNEFGDVVSDNYQRCVEQKEAISYEEELNLPGGTRIWLTTLTPILKSVEDSYIVGSAIDITERKKLELELKISANYDKLTQIPNRRLFFDKMKDLITKSKKNEFALLFIDLNKFKQINDKDGHEAGDKVLINIAKRLLDYVDKKDNIARIGGDEFTVILNTSKREVIDAEVKKILNALNRPIHINKKEYIIGTSIGVAIFPQDGDDFDSLMRNADSAMYDVKRRGISDFKYYHELDKLCRN